MVLGQSKFPLETKYSCFFPIPRFDPIRFPGIPTNRIALPLSQNTRDSFPRPLLVSLQKVVHAGLRPPNQFRQFSNRHPLFAARNNLLAFVSQACVPLVLYSLATARASHPKSSSDPALQAVANTLRHLGSRSQVVDDVEHPPPELAQVNPTPRYAREENTA